MDTASISLLISIGVLVASVISPIAVAIINNFHQTKIKRIEILTEYKLKAVEEYLECVGQCRKNQFGNAIDKYAHAYGRAVIYASEDTRKIMNDIDSRIHTGTLKNTEFIGIDVPEGSINKVCESLRKDLKINKYSL